MPRYEYKEGRVRWFWDVDLSGRVFTTTYGRVGSVESTNRKAYATDAEAKKHYDALLTALHGKGHAPLKGGAVAGGRETRARTVAMQSTAAAKGPKASRFLVPLAVLRDRLFASDIPTKRWGLSSTLDFARVLAREPDAVGLWIDVSWDKLSPRDLRAPSTKLVAAVFTKPIKTKRSLLLREQDLFGFRGERDGPTVFVFLGPVRARDICQVPDTLAIFARGLTVERIASFDGGDSSTVIASHLEAPYVVSGVGGGWVNLEPKTVVEVGAYAHYIRGLPRGTKAIKHKSLGEMLPSLADECESSEAWEVIADFIKSERELLTKRASGARTRSRR